MHFTGNVDDLLSSLKNTVDSLISTNNKGSLSFDVGTLAELIVQAQEKFHGKGTTSQIYNYYSRLIFAVKTDENSLYNLYIKLIDLSNQLYMNLMIKKSQDEGEDPGNVNPIFELDGTCSSKINNANLNTYGEIFIDCTSEPSAITIWETLRNYVTDVFEVNRALKNSYNNMLGDVEWSLKEEIFNTLTQIDNRIGNLTQVICECALNVGTIASELDTTSATAINDLDNFKKTLLSAYPESALQTVKDNYKNATGFDLNSNLPTIQTGTEGQETLVAAAETTTETSGDTKYHNGGEKAFNQYNAIETPNLLSNATNIAEQVQQASQENAQAVVQQPTPVAGLIGGDHLHVSGKSTEAFKQQAGVITEGHQNYTIVPDSQYTNQPGTISEKEYQIVIAQVAGEGANNPSDMFGVACTMFNRREQNPNTNFTNVLATGYWPWGKTYLAYMPGGQYYNTQWGQDKLAIAKQVVDQALQGYRNLPSDGIYYYGDGKNNYFRNIY